MMDMTDTGEFTPLNLPKLMPSKPWFKNYRKAWKPPYFHEKNPGKPWFDVPWPRPIQLACPGPWAVHVNWGPGIAPSD